MDYIVEGDIHITPEFLNEQDFSNLKQTSKPDITIKSGKFDIGFVPKGYRVKPVT